MNASIKNKCETEDIFLFSSDDEDSTGEESNENSNCKAGSIVNTNNCLYDMTKWPTQHLNHKESCIFLTESSNEDKIHEIFDNLVCLYDTSFNEDALPRADLPFTNIPDKEISKAGFIPRVIALSEKKSIQAGSVNQNEGQRLFFAAEPNDNDRANEELGDEPAWIFESPAKSDEMLTPNLQSSTNNRLSQFYEDNISLIEVLSEKLPIQTENVDLREGESCIFEAESNDYNDTSGELGVNYVSENDSHVKLDEIFNLQSSTNAHQPEFFYVNSGANETILLQENSKQTGNADCRDSCMCVSLSDGDENLSKDPVTITETLTPGKKLKVDNLSSNGSDSPESWNFHQGSNKVILPKENSEQTSNVDCRDSCVFVTLSNNAGDENVNKDPVTITETIKSDKRLKVDKLSSISSDSPESSNINQGSNEAILLQENFEQIGNVDCRDSCVFVTVSGGNEEDNENLSEDPVTITETIKHDKKLKVNKISSTRFDSLGSLNVNQGSSEAILLQENFEQIGNVDCRDSCVFVTVSGGDEEDNENFSEDPVTITETIKRDKKLKVDKISSTRSDSLESLNVNQGSSEIILYEKERVQPESVHHCVNCLFVTLSDEDSEELREGSATVCEIPLKPGKKTKKGKKHSSIKCDFTEIFNISQGSNKNSFQNGTVKNVHCKKKFVAESKRGKKRKKKSKDAQQNNKKSKFTVSSFVRSTVSEALYEETSSVRSSLCKSSCDPLKNVSHSNSNPMLNSEIKKKKKKLKLTKLRNKRTKLNGSLLPAASSANFTIPEITSTAVNSLCQHSCDPVKHVSHNSNPMLNSEIKKKTKKKLKLTKLKNKKTKQNASLKPAMSAANLALPGITNTARLPVSKNVHQNIECKENVVCVTLSDTEDIAEKESYGSFSSIPENSESLEDTGNLKKKVLKNKKKPGRCKQKSQKKKKMRMKATSKHSSGQKEFGLCEITNLIDRLPVSENVNQNTECKENIVSVTLSDTGKESYGSSLNTAKNSEGLDDVVCVTISDTEDIAAEKESYGSCSSIVKNSESLGDTVLLKKKVLKKKKPGRLRKWKQKLQKKNNMKMRATLKQTSGQKVLALCEITNTIDRLPVSENVNQNTECKENIVSVTLSDTEKESYGSSLNTAKNSEGLDDVVCVTISDTEDVAAEKESYGSCSSIVKNSESLGDTVQLKKKVLKKKKPGRLRKWKQKLQKKNNMKMRATLKQTSGQKVLALCEITSTIDRLPVSENVNQNTECKENIVSVTLSDTEKESYGSSLNTAKNSEGLDDVVCVTVSDTEDIAEKESYGSCSIIAKNSESLGDTVLLKKKVLENKKKPGRLRKWKQKLKKKMKMKMRATLKQTSGQKVSGLCEITNTIDRCSPSKKSKSINGISWNPPLHRLRPVVIDGSNVAIAHGRVSHTFSSKGIQLAVDYFLNRGHTQVTAFVPFYRRSSKCHHSFPTVGQEILEKLAIKQHVVFTPSRYIKGKCIASYDDRFVVQLASEIGGIIVSNDSYRDLINESESFREAIEERLLMFCFVGDIFMVPEDPLGRDGPRLQEYLCFPEEYTEA